MPTPDEHAELTQQTLERAREEARRFLDMPTTPTPTPLLVCVLQRLINRCKEAGVNVCGCFTPAQREELDKHERAQKAAFEEALRLKPLLDEAAKKPKN